MNTEGFAQETITADKGDPFTMTTEKMSETSSSPVTHAEHLAADGENPTYRHSTVPGQPGYSEHGPLVDHKLPPEEVVQAEPDLRWSRIRHYMREPFSEFFGVFILIMFGDGVVAQVVLSGGTRGDYQSISWGWGLGVMLGVYSSGISGGKPLVDEGAPGD